jgi:Transposase
VWRQDTSKAAEPRAKLSHRGLRWALEGIVCTHLTVARVADGLGVAWDTANDAVLAEGQRVLINDERRFDGVAVVGVDEHVWRHTRRGDKYVTVIIDLTPIRDGSGPSRLLDMVEGRSKKAFKTWLAGRPQAWRDGVQVVAMDRFTGFKTATAEELPDAVPVMDPFHVVRLAGDALERCRQRVQQECLGHRGRAGDPLFRARRTLHTGDDLLTDRQREHLMVLFTADEHVDVEATWGIYQRIIAAYRHPDRTQARERMQAVIDTLREGVPTALTELRTFGRTLARRAEDVLAYFDRPGTSNGPTEAINGRLEHLRGSALGFRNLTNYIARSLLETGGFRPRYTLDWDEPQKRSRTSCGRTRASTATRNGFRSFAGCSFGGPLFGRAAWRLPDTYHPATRQASGGGTATQVLQDPGQPRIGETRDVWILPQR